MYLKDFISDSVRRLQPLYPVEEAKAIVLELCRGILGTERYTHVIYPGTVVEEGLVPVLDKAVERLSSGEPLQYVIGYTEFSGFRFRVTSDVLIPRPETEEMCREAVAVARGMVESRERLCRGCASLKEMSHLKILDLCTGSGCIAWTLALSVPGAEVVGVDISEKALDVASSQELGLVAEELGARVPRFVRYDVLDGPDGFEPGEFDIILSNPPYVMESEKSLMRSNVLDHEPELALFVPDSDPLKFFRAVADFAKKRLRSGGFGMVEINEALEGPTATIFSSSGFSEISVQKDFRDKFRFVSFKKQA